MNENSFSNHAPEMEDDKTELIKNELFAFHENGRDGTWLDLEKDNHHVEGALYSPKNPNGETIIFVSGMPGDSVVWFENNDLDILLKKGYQVFTIRHNGTRTSLEPDNITNNTSRSNFSPCIGKDNFEIDDLLHEPELAMDYFSSGNVSVISHSLGGLAVGTSLINLGSENKGQNISKWVNLAGVTYTPEQFEESTKTSWEHFVNNYLGNTCNFKDGDKIVSDIGEAIRRFNERLLESSMPENTRVISVNPEKDEYVPVDSGLNIQEKTKTGLVVRDRTLPEDFLSDPTNQGKMVHDMPNLLPETLIRLVEMNVSKFPHQVTFNIKKDETPNNNQTKQEVNSSTNKFYDNEGSEYWTKREPMVMGDLRNRPPMMELVGDIKDHTVLEGARVFGCDISQEMLTRAENEEKEHPMRIEYKLGDVTDLPYENESMDEVVSCGVLIHFDQEVIEKSLIEAKRVLKLGGHLIIGVMHPYLYSPESPNRKTEGKSWGKYISLEENKPYEESQRFREDYYDKNGKLFSSEVWHHTIETYKKLIEEAGLEIEEIQEQNIEKEDLISQEWGDDYGYPAFLHIKATKRV
jgi:ubiquinone/menaquinone biosynthesis C-methylase UbiE